jgi:hypothetical protein
MPICAETRTETALSIISNPAREAIVETLQVAPCSSNWRFRLAVDTDTEKVVIEVQRRKRIEARLFDHVFFHYYTGWETQRRIAGRSYEELLKRLREQPEFLETEIIVAGFLETAHA